MKNIQQITNRLSLIVALLILALLWGGEASAQQRRKIDGKVSDNKGEPLIGVTILIKGGTASGTTTNIDGDYSITIPESGQLQFSYIGYTSKNFALDKIKGSRLNVQLEEDSKELEELIVVGYGSMQKSDLTGALTRVTPLAEEAASATSVQSLMQGVTGVQMVTGSAPGASVEFVIRGNSSLSSTAPLYVVDGMVMSSTLNDVNGGDAMTSGQNGLTGVNAQDIENIEVLKDASATAIYGALGANGVILITTKSGKSDIPRIQYSGNMTYQYLPKKREMLSFDEYNEFNQNVRGRTLDMETITPVDWQDMIIRPTLSHGHRLTISGRTDKTNYYIAGGLSTNNGIMLNSDNKQADIRMNIDQQVSKNVKVGIKTSLMYSAINSATGSRFASQGSVLGMRIERPYMNKGQQLEDDSETTDEEELQLRQGPYPYIYDFVDFSEEYRSLTSAYLSLQINKKFSMRTTAGIDYRNKSRQQWFGPTTGQGKSADGKAFFGTLESLNFNIDHTYEYKLSKGKHRVTALAGIIYNQNESNNFGISTSKFNGNVAGKEEGVMYGELIDASTYTRQTIATLSFMTRVTYSYDNKYVLTGTFRADGSSRFSSKNRFAYFPSLALAYRLTQEPFLKDNYYLSNAKIRLGWGMTGNQSTGAYATMLNISSTRLPQDDGSFTTGYYPSNIPNPNLKWETTDAFNVGLDLGLFNNRLNITFDAYHKQSRDLLQSVTVPYATGFNRMSVNLGSIRNQGVELSIDGSIVRNKKWDFALNANISLNDNRIMDLGLEKGRFGNLEAIALSSGMIGSTGTTDLQCLTIEGMPVSQFFARKTKGIVQKQDELDDRAVRRDNYIAQHGREPQNELEYASVKGNLPISTTYGFNSPQILKAGDPYYEDLNGDGIINDDDYTLIGSPLPKFTYGFGLNLRYDRLSLSAQFNGSYGNMIANVDRQKEENMQSNNYGNITRDLYQNYYTDDRPSTTHTRYGYNGGDATFIDRIHMEDGSFLRLSSLTVGYKLSFRRNSIIQGVNISLTGRNLFCLTNYSGYDPEVSSFSGKPTTLGINYAAYPRSRSFTLGVAIDF